MKYTKKYMLVSVLIMIMCNNLSGQSKYLHLLKGDNVAKAAKKISTDISKKPEDTELNYVMALLLINRQYSAYSPKSAYEYLLKSKQYFDNTTDIKKLEKLNKIPLNQSIYEDYTDSVCRYALEDAIRTNKLDSYQKFLDYYKTAPLYQQQKATENINRIAFRKTKVLDNIESYTLFIAQYPDANETKQATERIHKLAFDKAKIANSSAFLKAFIDEYPQSKQYDVVVKLLGKAQFRENIPTGSSWNQYVEFIDKYPNNSLVSVAYDNVSAYIEKTKDLEAAKFCVDNFKDNFKDRALILYHDIFTNDGEKQTLDLFYKQYDNEILDELKQQDYEIAELGDALTLALPYDSLRFSEYDSYIRLAAPRERAFVALQRIISSCLVRHNWKISIEILTRYESLFSRNTNLKKLIALLNDKWDNSIHISPLGARVNTVNGSEYAPAISANDKLLYFCGSDRKDNIGGEDIFVSKKVNGKWGQAKLVPGLSTAKTNDSPECISADGTMMIIFQSGKLYYSQKKSKGWSDIKEFPEQINAAAWQADAVLSSDGKAILFASIKKGGYNLYNQITNIRPFHGAVYPPSDIYVSTLNSKNQWSELINLGNVINTPYCDRSPFLHPDMKTLYFSSDGHGGLGKLDVYKSTRLADSCWNCWSEPINMGKEINTVGSDWGYKISTNGEVAYFSIANSVTESEDIYSVNVPKNVRPEIVATISGKLLDKNNKPINAEIKWEDLETGKNVGQSKSDPTDGSFFIVLPVGKIYGYFVDQDEYFPISNHVDLRNNNKPVRIEENINMVTFRQMIEEGIAVPINNLFFNFAESSLLPYSISELKRVASIFKTNHLKIEIGGHTDNIGNDQKNQILSEQRAKSVMEFLINEGCTAGNLSIKGYGRTKPIATNETEEGRAKNRRVEFKFIK